MIVSPARDGIEIRDIERREWMKREQPARHVYGIAGRRQRRLDRTILIALTHAGAHHGALLEIEHGNDLHFGADFRMQMTTRYETITGVGRNGTCAS
jgi:hypothetical protein